MKTTVKCILVGLGLLCSVGAAALDLPVKTINGRQYYYYRAERNESVHGLSKKLGVTREQIVQYNPGVADGVRRGTIVYLPVDEFSEVEAEIEGNVEVAEEREESRDDREESRDERYESGESRQESVDLRHESGESLVVVAQPFGLDGDSESRRSRHALDFYKGLLIAADTLSYRHTDTHILAMDCLDGTPDQAIPAQASVVIAPEDAAFATGAALQCAQNGTYIFNVLNVRDTSYLSNPFMVQANIPADMMYAKAVEGLFKIYPDYTPAIIRNTSGRNEKDPFTRYLRDYCDSVGREYVKIEYSGNLATADLEPIEADGLHNYVIVPSSGTLAEFNKFAYVLRNFRDSRNRVEIPEPDELDSLRVGQRIAVFGYPDWIAFRSDAEELLHSLEATIYSRYYDNYDSFDSRNLEADFMHWYGAPMIESVPSQGLLGFDTGNYVLRCMRASGGRFDPAGFAEYRGAQSAFRFERVPGGGFVNTALYIVEFEPFGRMKTRIL